jgi:hypothetical protein
LAKPSASRCIGFAKPRCGEQFGFANATQIGFAKAKHSASPHLRISASPLLRFADGWMDGFFSFFGSASRCEAGQIKAKRFGFIGFFGFTPQRGVRSTWLRQSEAVRNADGFAKSNQCNTEEVTNGLFLFINLIMILYLVILIRATVVP